MKKSFFSGLAIFLPIAITIWIINFIVDALTHPFTKYVESWLLLLPHSFIKPILQYGMILNIIAKIVILIMLFCFIILLGYLGQKIFFHWIIKQIHKIFMKIPLINALYRACKDIISAFFVEDRKVFKTIVSAPFPNMDTRSLGLVSGDAPQEIQEKCHASPSNPIKVIFIATSPHPTSGFLLLTQEQNLVVVDISFEDAFKFLISCGVFIPKKQNF